MTKYTVTNTSPKTILVGLILLLTGCGSSFTDSGQLLGAVDSRSLALGAVDGDNHLDVVVANQNQGNRIYLNDSDGEFKDSGRSLGTNSSQSVALGDLS